MLGSLKTVGEQVGEIKVSFMSLKTHQEVVVLDSIGVLLPAI